jgi:RHS repeat-associated protein
MKIHYHSDHLGSASFVTNAEGAVVQHLQYLPYGELFVSQRNTEEFDSRYKFTAKELDNETSYTYFGARYYDSELSVWLSVDPMSDKYPSLSPYCYTADNPVVLVDPNGTRINPIYDKETSEFLGTDDRGLQGEAIIMNKEDFKQGMSHEEAMSKGKTLDNMSFDEALEFANNGKFKDFIDHYNNLPNRPDWDGYLTLNEANEWYREGGGKPLFVDAAKIDLSPVKKSDFSKVGDSFYKNFAFTTNTETGLVYGNIKLTLMNDKGVIKLGGTGGLLDIYDFDYKSGVKNIPRNIDTWIGKQRAGRGTGYDIFNYGTGTVK